jgi:hypothetical protein
MNYTKLFYWLTVADNAKSLFVTFTCIFTSISVIATLTWFIMQEEDETQKMCRKWMWWSYPFMILFWSLDIFTPSKKDALLIVAGGQTLNFLTSDSTAKQIPHELSSFVVTELKNMAENAKVDLNIASQKDKILEEAKNMTANQLMDKMKLDSNFAKIVLDK